MSYAFEEKPYFQPAHFGPAPITPVLHYGDLTSVYINYLTDKDVVATMLPPGFEPADIPIVTVWAQYCREVSFMAGQGYNIVGVNFAAVWNGKKETLDGAFSAVLWENDFIPIMVGRDHLGAPKIWGDIPDLQMKPDNSRRFFCSERGMPLVEGTVTDLVPLSEAELTDVEASFQDGNWFCWKYISHANQKQADLSCPTALKSQSKLNAAWTAQGTHQFYLPKWEEAPLSAHVMAGLGKLKVKEYTDSFICQGENDLLFGDIKYLE